MLHAFAEALGDFPEALDAFSEVLGRSTELLPRSSGVLDVAAGCRSLVSDLGAGRLLRDFRYGSCLLL